MEIASLAQDSNKGWLSSGVATITKLTFNNFDSESNINTKNVFLMTEQQIYRQNNQQWFYLNFNGYPYFLFTFILAKINLILVAKIDNVL